MMAKLTSPDTQAKRFAFTRDRVDGAQCESGKSQSLFWDTKQPGLGLRVTANGARSFIFESKLGRQTIRMTIGPASMQIRAAKDRHGRPLVAGADTRAAELAGLVSQGRDPRKEMREAIQSEQTARAETRRRSATARDAWDAYLIDRAPHWGARHLQDHRAKAEPGRAQGLRGKPIAPGPLAPLLLLPLRGLDAATIEAWAAKEGRTRPASARLAWRLLKAFLAWVAEQPEYAGALPEASPATTRKSREALGTPGVKRDVLLKEQLPAWFAAVQALPNPVAAAYLQTVLLTGARPGEVITLRWSDINAKWRGLTIRDKVEGNRVFPLTPYVAHLLAALPRRNANVFSGVRAPILAAPHEFHAAACAVAGLDGLTLHGLRRSYKSLSEWLEIPAGVVAQLMGHKPSAIAEKHYTVRPLDLLRIHAERFEAWMLTEARIEFDPGQATVAAPRLVRAK